MVISDFNTSFHHEGGLRRRRYFELFFLIWPILSACKKSAPSGPPFTLFWLFVLISPSFYLWKSFQKKLAQNLGHSGVKYIIFWLWGLKWARNKSLLLGTFPIFQNLLTTLTNSAMAAFSTLRGFGWCFSMCFPKFWLDVYILSQSLQSNFPMSILWVRLCCVRYLFCVNVFPHVSQLNIITAGFLIFTMSPPQFNWCFCKQSFRVYTFSHFSHSNLLSMWVFMCLASLPFATPLTFNWKWLRWEMIAPPWPWTWTKCLDLCQTLASQV